MGRFIRTVPLASTTTALLYDKQPQSAASMTAISTWSVG